MLKLQTSFKKCPNCGKQTIIDCKRTHLKEKQKHQDYIYTHWEKCTNCRFIRYDDSSKMSPQTFLKTFGQEKLL
jgi:predicted RNA-binding Zn-ribbon protein involved in translation (DUF1610 family)